MLDEYIPYLEARWAQGCEDARALWREIQSLGYFGGYGLVNKWLRPRRRKSSPYTTKKALRSSHWVQKTRQATPKFPSAKKIARILLQPENHLSDEEGEFIRELHQDSAIAKLYPLIQGYQGMIHKRDSSLFDNWLEECAESDIPRLRTFAEGIQKDHSAVRNALDFHWSNGPTEGHINRLKLIKRQMFGRAKLDLLKRKFLYLNQEHQS
ncbi:MAG: transposase [Cyclobacteriaceae bacterium]|nr:transposase [Cyclobacteriaceae bacterium]